MLQSVVRTRAETRRLLLLLPALLLPLGSGWASRGAVVDDPTGKAAGGPAAAVPAAVPASVPAEVPAAVADQRDELGTNGLPSARALLQRFVAAIGGEERFRSVRQMTMKGSMEMAAMGIKGSVVVVAAAPNQMVMTAEMAGMGSMSNGYNGEVGWSENPMTGPAVLSGELLDQTIREADFYDQLEYDRHYPTQETIELSQWAGEAAYKLRLVDKSGREAFEYYGEKSGLLLGREGVQATEMGEVEMKITMSEYRDFGGLMLPALSVMSFMGMEIKQTVDEVSFAPIDPAAFEPPDAIKALLQQK